MKLLLFTAVYLSGAAGKLHREAGFVSFVSRPKTNDAVRPITDIRRIPGWASLCRLQHKNNT
jgi:hypothetical protein